MLIRSQCEDWLSGHHFGPFKQITEAYFLFGYERAEIGCPYRTLSLYGLTRNGSELGSQD